ncbi:MAG: FtsX-like permease family protein [Bacilli bacterium]
MTKSLMFKLKFALRNATKKKGRFIVVILTLIMMIMLGLMVFAMRDYLIDIFTFEYEEQYQDIDLIVTYDNYSSSRIVNSRTIKEQYPQYFSFTATFFNLHSLVKTDNISQYTQILSSSLAEFERVVKFDVNALNPNEMLISQSLATKLNVNKSDYLYLEIDNQDLSYLIKEIIPDQGLFKGDVVFINKDELFERTVWSSSPNLGNFIYLNVKSEYSLNDVKELLLNDINYQDCLIYEAIDNNQILVSAKYNTSIMLGMIIVIFLAMAMVIKSLFPLLFRDFSQQLGVIKILGGNNHFAFHIWVLQFIIYFAIAIPLGIGLANLFMNIGAKVYQVNTYIGIRFLPILLTLLLFLSFMTWQIIHQFHRLTKQNALTLTADRKSEHQTSEIIYLVCFALLLIINVVINPLPRFQALFTTVLVIGFSFTFISSLLRFFPLLFTKKQSFFTIFSIKYLSQNKITHNSLKVIFISLVVLAVSLTMSSMFKSTQRKATEEIELNYLMTNIYDYQNSLKEDIIANFTIDNISDGIIYQDVTMAFANDKERLLKFVLSINPMEIDHYFNYQFLDDSLISLQDSSKLSVVLPYQFEKIGAVKKGDFISLYLSQSIPQAIFEVVGFYENYSEGIAFTNLHLSDQYQSEPIINSLFINSFDPNIQKDLIKKYSNKIYFIFDAQSLFLNEVDRLVAIADFLSFIIWVLIGCFVLVIMNNSLLVFYSLKADYAKIKILGYNNRELFVNIIKEIVVLMILAFFASFVNVMIVFQLFPSLLVMVGYYFQYQYSISAVLWYLLIGILVFSISYLYYFLKIRKMNLIQETINL